ncbi:MAG: Helicase PriA essential for oriC/DnaA-independent DNA replication [Candidatus Saccharicenans subterraneus]|uniref:Helicase PriA essential for oriC/DnaA-independent DNA replication n=1 Tax=Candidatus Saccharicenans subterraneus TaxID=2508984 RepID=A0A3E2BL26_9BACT|nr:MAG: Helicase PriA essential for oriC/DnaA-independent DNA replication [Candidatus Saccharicenans subterraneum]
MPVFQTFLYRLPPELAGKVRVGSKVVAPLGSRKLPGYVLEVKELAREPEFKVREIISCPPDSVTLPEVILKLALELSERSLTAPGLLLEMAEPPAAREKPRLRLTITEKGLRELVSGRLKGRRGQILSLLAERQLSPVYIKRKLKLREVNSYLRSLGQEGLLEIREKVTRKKPTRPVGADNSRQLVLPVRPEGLPEAGQPLLEGLESGRGGAYLLTGSLDRRLRFLEKIMDYAAGHYGFVIFLVPDIQRLEKLRPLEKAFGGRAAFWHSQLPDKVRNNAWNQLVSGRSRIVFGTRSALFLPVRPVSLLVIDEEHDDLYYQADGPSFDAREAAEVRSGLEKSLLIFSSACPRVSQYHRHRQSGTLIDLGEPEAQPRVSFYQKDIARLLKKELREEISPCLEAGGRIFFLVNRKGYAGYLFCPGCGYVARCSSCRIALNLQKKDGELSCSYCGLEMPAPEECPVCRQKLRPGRIRGSQYLKEQLQVTFPGQPVEVLEEGGGEKAAEKSLKRIVSGKSRLVVGTEYALRRLPLNHFSFLVLVNPETSLNRPDFTASEKTVALARASLELLRSGEDSMAATVTAGPPSEVLVQALSGDYPGFFEREIDYRRLLNYPPFSFLVEVGLDSRSLRGAGRSSRLLLEHLGRDFPGLELLGPKVSRKAWRKEQREVRLMVRLSQETEVEELLSYLKKFRMEKPSTRLWVRVWR